MNFKKMFLVLMIIAFAYVRCSGASKNNNTSLILAIQKGESKTVCLLLDEHYDALSRQRPIKANIKNNDIIQTQAQNIFPSEIWEAISQYLPAIDLAHLNVTCKNCYAVTNRLLEERRTLQLKKNLVGDIELALQAAIKQENDVALTRRHVSKYIKPARIITYIITAELENAHALDIRELLQGIISCNGQLRCKLMDRRDELIQAAKESIKQCYADSSNEISDDDLVIQTVRQTT